MSGQKMRSPGKLAARGFPKIRDWENPRLGKSATGKIRDWENPRLGKSATGKIRDWENPRLGRASREIGNSVNARMPRGKPRGILALILEQIEALFTRFRGTDTRDSFESASVSRK
jgi:hypothetical protein